jgi:DNA invertase Pin-like site-specific DNA recombinase
MQKAIIYCRVSSIKQSTEGHGLDSQEHRCREFAERKGYEVVKTFKDSFSGGGDFMDRPAMASLLGFLDKNLLTNYVVIFDDLKRFARDTVFHIKLRQAFDARGAKVECPNFTFEDTPEGSFIETVLAAQNELERKQNQRQVIQKMKARLEKGYWSFVAPHGYNIFKDQIHGKVLKKDELKANLIKEALEGFAFGRFENQMDVKKFLEINKFLSSKTVSLDIVKKLLTNPLYAGYVQYDKWGVSRRVGHHEPLIDSSTFEIIQDKLAGKIKVLSRKDNSKEFPLRGFVLCAECNKPMTASWTTGRNGKHPYYHCKTKTCTIKGKTVRRKEIEDKFEDILKTIKPKEKTLSLTKEILLDLWNKKLTDIDNIKRSHESNLDSVRSKIRMYLDRIGKTENEAMIKTYEAEIQKLTDEEKIMESQVKVIRGTNPDFGTALDLAFTFLKNPYLYWKKDDLVSKHLVLKLVFTDRIAYTLGTGFGTANLSLPLRVFELNQLNDSSLVDTVLKSWNQLESWVFEASESIIRQDKAKNNLVLTG